MRKMETTATPKDYTTAMQMDLGTTEVECTVKSLPKIQLCCTLNRRLIRIGIYRSVLLCQFSNTSQHARRHSIGQTSHINNSSSQQMKNDNNDEDDDNNNSSNY